MRDTCRQELIDVLGSHAANLVLNTLLEEIGNAMSVVDEVNDGD